MRSVLRKFFGVVGTVLMLCQCVGVPALADDAGAPGVDSHVDGGSSCVAPGSVNLDLSSTAASVVFNGGSQAVPVNIDVAGIAQTVNPGQMLTPAQAVAAYQVMNNGTQNILLGADGAAIGGSMVIGSRLANILSGIVIPQGVTVVDKTANLNLTGNLTNSGTLYSVTNNAAVTAATISAANILNQQGGLLTTVLPDGGLASLGLANYGNVVSNLSLNLNAINNIVNAGIISSAGNLSMTAGGSIQNLMSGGVTPVMQAMNAVNMQAAQIVNQGSIIAALTNVNLVTNSLINAGAVQALVGNINIATMPSLDKTNLSILNGDFLSQALNITAANDGIVNINVNNISGIMNVSAGELHATSASPVFRLGSMHITGDPTYWNPTGDIQIVGDLSFNGQNLSLIAFGNIYTSGGNWAIDTSAAGNAGSILMIAGVDMTPTSGGTGGDTSGGADSSTTLTLNGPSTSGGSIDLTGSGSSPITQLTSNSTSNGDGGPITLVAYEGGTSGTGTITLPANVTILTGTALSNGFTLNGNVSIIAGASSGDAISIGGINTSGNSTNPTSANNGLITINSATPEYWANPNGSTATQLSAGNSFTDTVITVNSTTGLNVTDVIYINPLGGNGEQVTISAIDTGNNTITVSPLTYSHTIDEAIYIATPNTTGIQVAPIGVVGSVPSGLPMTNNGGIIMPGTQQSGSISIGGQVIGNNAITIATSPNASGSNGTVSINDSMNLTMNVTQATNPITPYQSFPAISITGTTVNIDGGATVSSQIFSGTVSSPGTTYANAPNTITIITQNLNNAGTITGGDPSSAPFSNSYINIQAPSGESLTVTGNGTYSVPSYSVIEFAGADTQNLSINSSPTISTGPGSLVIFNAQGSGGIVALAANQTLTINGGPVVSINTPQISLGAGSSINAAGASTVAITAGYTTDDLNVTTDVSGNSTISVGSGGAIKMRPKNNADLNITSTGSGTLTLSGATALLAVSGTGTISVTSSVLSSSSYTSVTNPSGGIFGGEYQPYVGGYFASLNGSPPDFVAFSAYPFHVVLAMMAPIIADQQVQILATYTQQYSTSYVIGAAKQVGLNVSGGVFVDLDGSTGTNIAPDRTAFDTNWVLSQASLYGNVVDIVVGNEDIGGNVTATANTLTSTIQSVQAQRNNTADPVNGGNYNSTTLPVTTRQQIGVLAGDVANYPAMQTLVGTVEDHIYGNAYPFFDENNVVPTLISNPGISQSAFQTLVLNNMNAQYQAAANSIKTNVTNAPNLLIGETGWATPLLAYTAPSASTGNMGYGYAGSSLPQQSTTWAGWYYQAMQYWSATTPNIITGNTGVAINGYFGLYNEPWKGIDGGAPGGSASSLLNAANAGATTIQTCCTNPFPTLTPQSIIINPNQSTQEVQNIFNINGTTLTISALLNNHSAGEVIDAGHPEEPYFGLYVAGGITPFNSSNVNDTGNGYVFTLTGTSSAYSLPVYAGNPAPAPPEPAAVVVFVPPSNLSQLAFNNLLGLAAAAQNASAQQANFNEQLGTRIATDFNPYTTYPNQPASFNPANPLQGGVVINGSGNIGQGLFAATTFNVNELQALAQNGVEFGPNSGGNFFDLTKGYVLFTPANDIQVQTKEGIVSIPKGAVVWVMETGNDAAVYDLHDSMKNPVKVLVNNKEMVLAPGKQILLTRDSKASFDELNPGGNIGTRNVRTKEMGAGIKAYIADFTISGGATSVATIRSLLKSDNPEHQKAAHKMLKNAAILTDLGGYKEPYKTK